MEWEPKVLWVVEAFVVAERGDFEGTTEVFEKDLHPYPDRPANAVLIKK